MTTPDAEAVAALADHGLTGCANPAHHDMCLVAAERKLTALNAAGWHLVRRSERRSAVIGSERSDNEALVAAVKRLPLFDESDLITAMNGTVRSPRTIADYVEGYRNRVLAAIEAER